MGIVRRLVSQLGKKKVASKSREKASTLGFEAMEDRLVMDVSVGSVGSFVLPTTKSIFVPISATDSDGMPLQFEATSSNEDVQVEVVEGGRSLLLNVSGTDEFGLAFTGTITIRLFEDLAPETTAQIIDLAQQGFYNGLDFHRIIDNFVAQGGDGDEASDAYKIDDEFHTDLTFTSPGLLAMANAGDDTGTTQFFLTDFDIDYNNLPQHLNFNHTIFGQVTSGFEILDKMMNTETETKTDGTTDSPVNPVVINSMTVITDNQNAVLRITGADDFEDTVTITVTGTNAKGQSDQMEFAVRGAEDAVNDTPFLGPVPNLTTLPGQAITFTPTATDLDGDDLIYTVSDGSQSGVPPTNATVTVDDVTGKITITPNDGFVGTMKLLIHVSDGTNSDSQLLEVEVTAGLAKPTAIVLDVGSDTGLSNSDNFTSDNTPTIKIEARAGSTVEVLVNGMVVGQATETSAGKYEFTLPSGKLALGNNSITARTISGTETSQATAPLTVFYEPTSTDLFTVPGIPGTGTVELRFEYTSQQAMYRSEFGFFIVDDADGTVNGLRPGDAGYAQAALSQASRQTIFSQASKQGEVAFVDLEPGQRLGFYVITNGSVETFLEGTGDETVQAVFGSPLANGDGIDHMQAVTDAVFGEALLAWEDTWGGGDHDYNDLVVGIRLATAVPPPSEPSQALTVGGSGRLQQQALFQLLAFESGRNLTGEFGFFYVDDVTGKIGDLMPHQAGYAQAALEAGRRQTLFKSGDEPGSLSVTMSGQTTIGFYYIPNGSASEVLDGTRTAYFSFDLANANRAQHFQWYSTEQNSLPSLGNDSQLLTVTGPNFSDFYVGITFS